MKKKAIAAGVAVTLLCSSAYVLSRQQINKQMISTQETTSLMGGKSTPQPDYNAIANDIKSSKEPVVVGQVFENGYLKKHGKHYHFVKGAPPKDAIYEQAKQTDDDGYVFNPKDIVEENEWGYVVKHGNHYHFVYKKQNSATTHAKAHGHSNLSQLSTNPIVSPHKLSPLERRIAEIMQKYGLQRHHIIANEAEGTIIYPHGNHYHYEKIGDTYMPHDDHHEHNEEHHHDTDKKEDNVPSIQDGNKKEDNTSSETTPLSEKIEKRIAEIMKRYGLTRDQIKVDTVNHTIIYPHGNHYHYEKIDETYMPHDDHEDHGEDNTSKQGNDAKEENKKDDAAPLSEELEKRVAELMKKYHLTRDQIKVDIENNAIIYPHGSHYHYEKIDPSKPITNHNRHGIKEEKDDGLAHTETHKIVGPLAVTREQLLNKEAIAKAYPNLPIKNMAHYHIVGFLAYPNSRQKVGDLKHNGQLTDGVIYLVLKNTPWKEVAQSVTLPQTQPKEGYYFKDWTHTIPTEDIVDYPRIFGAQFRLEKYKNSPVVLGPSATKEIKGSENVDLHDYVPVSFHTISNGNFLINGIASKHAFYLIKQGTTWKEAFANGFALPQTQAESLFEFSQFSKDVTQHLDEKVSSEYIWAKFGSTAMVVGAYKPTNSNNPLSKMDPKRPHPNDTFLPYDENKYVTLAFVAGDNGQLDTFFEQSKVLTYIVRRGTTWRELQAELPQIAADAGYRLKESSVLPNSDEKIESDRIYQLEFEKIMPVTNVDTSQGNSAVTNVDNEQSNNVVGHVDNSQGNSSVSNANNTQNNDAVSDTNNTQSNNSVLTADISQNNNGEPSVDNRQSVNVTDNVNKSQSDTVSKSVDTTQSNDTINSVENN